MAYKHIALRFISVLVIHIYLASSYVAATEHIGERIQDSKGIQSVLVPNKYSSKLIASVGNTIRGTPQSLYRKKSKLSSTVKKTVLIKRLSSS